MTAGAGHDLSGARDGVPERFVPETMHGELVEAEHIARYWWATRLCAGRRALDAGCGIGYGAAMLAASGATEVVAVDISEPIIEVARQRFPPGVSGQVANISELPFPDGSFDLVVCFEAIEHVEDPDRALDEFARVLRPEGILLISSPNRARYVPGNPHHRHEYLPTELREALALRFAAARLLRQHVMIASVITVGDEPEEWEAAPVRRLASSGEDDETYVIGMAGHTAQLPDPQSPLVTLTQFVELRRWLEHFQRQDEHLRAAGRALEELDQLRRERQQALRLLAEREREVDERESLRASLRRSEQDAERLREMLQVLEERRLRAERVTQDVVGSLSWRVTAPLRAAKHRGRR